MRVAIDGLSYFLNKSDIGEYTRGLVDNITPLENDKIYLIRDREIAYKNLIKNKLKLSNLYINRLNNDYKSTDDFINNSKIDIYHCTNNGFSLQSKKKYNCNIITTIHSFIPSEYENFYEKNYLKKYFNALQNWDRYSDFIVCPSEYIENEINFKLGISRDKIVVIPPKVSEVFSRTNNYISGVYIKSKYKFSGEFILYCGDIHKRKRLEEFLNIYSRITTKLKQLYFVILCNVDSINLKYYEELKILVEALRLENKVIFITSYNSIDKLHFYNTCKAIIDFSLYEGLNISLMEARAVGANIICSDIQTYREELNDYPLYLNMELPFIDEILEDYLCVDDSYKVEDTSCEGGLSLYDLYEIVLNK